MRRSCLRAATVIMALMLTGLSMTAQAGRLIELTEKSAQSAWDVGEKGQDDAEEEETLTEECEKDVKAYEAQKRKIQQKVRAIDALRVLGGLVTLSEGASESSKTPDVCQEQLAALIDQVKKEIQDALAEKDAKGGQTQEDDEAAVRAELFVSYRRLYNLSQDICSSCDDVPSRLRDDHITCQETWLPSSGSGKASEKKVCHEALATYGSVKETLLYKERLCSDLRTIESYNAVQGWFQGSPDLPLTCALKIKQASDVFQRSAEANGSLPEHTRAMMTTMCEHGLFSLKLQFGEAAAEACSKCADRKEDLHAEDVPCVGGGDSAALPVKRRGS